MKAILLLGIKTRSREVSFQKSYRFLVRSFLSAFWASLMLYSSVLLVSPAYGAGGNWANFSESGLASYYAMKYQSKLTASGEKFDQKKRTAAHKKLPFGTKVKVTNVNNKKTVTVIINDRGPFVKGRVIDLSASAFHVIADSKQGVIKVKIEVVS